MNRKRLKQQFELALACLEPDSPPQDFRTVQIAARQIGRSALKRYEQRLALVMFAHRRGQPMPFAGRDKGYRFVNTTNVSTPQTIEARYRAIDLVMPPGRMTADEVWEALGWAPSTTRRLLKELDKAGLIRRVEPDKPGNNVRYVYERATDPLVPHEREASETAASCPAE